MQIPHEVSARPDTGLYNAKLGIWLFLASEVMLFGGLFSAYIFLRMGAEDGYWPRGLLNVPVGAVNTAILIASSVTVVLAWASLKMRKFKEYKMWMAISIVCGLIFLIVKLWVEWPQKFHHFGAFIKKAELEHYEDYLGNKHRKEKGFPKHVEVSGHLHGVTLEHDPAVLEGLITAAEKRVKEIPNLIKQEEELLKASPEVLKEKKEQRTPTAIQNTIRSLKKEQAKLEGKLKDYPNQKFEVFLKKHDLEIVKHDSHAAQGHGEVNPKAQLVEGRLLKAATDKEEEKRSDFTPGMAEDLEKLPGVKFLTFELGLDPVNAEPENEESYKPHFWFKEPTTKPGTIKREHVEYYSSFAPKHSSYFAIYFTITGLHGLHVLAGVLIMIYFWLPISGGANMFQRNPEHLANRVEVVGLFWHFVDLVWIFVFPIFYLL
jgi:heme/copper-type cytochrome/quinol oxidase subunit 3